MVAKISQDEMNVFVVEKIEQSRLYQCQELVQSNLVIVYELPFVLLLRDNSILKSSLDN